MKDNIYKDFRRMLSQLTGSPILRLIKENQDKLGLDPDVFNLVYEGFWDLYSFHPQCSDVSARKLQVWIQKIDLKVRPGTEVEIPAEQPAGEGEGEGAEGEDEEAKEEQEKEKEKVSLDGVDKINPIVAVVRIKIPKVPKEPELDDEGNEIPDNTPESDLDDIPFEDKCLTFTTADD